MPPAPDRHRRAGPTLPPGRSGPPGTQERPVAAYPGTFDPPTVAHMAVARAALEQAGLARVELVLSRSPLGKSPSVPRFEDRMAVLSEMARSRPWMSVAVTDRRLIADVARGYDAVIMGMDKWLQVVDPAWYGGSSEARDTAVASLPPVLLAGRAGARAPAALPPGVRLLDVHPGHGPVSSTLARSGRLDWMTPEAACFDRLTGAWSDPRRYLDRVEAVQGCTDRPGTPG